MSKLYDELHDLMLQDSTIFQYIKLQDVTGASDFVTLIALVKQLANEKKIYLDDAIDTRNRSVVPILMTDKAKGTQ